MFPNGYFHMGYFSGSFWGPIKSILTGAVELVINVYAYVRIALRTTEP